MTKTKRNPRKEEREWQDLIHEKKAYLKRKQEDEDMKVDLRQWEQHLKEQLDSSE